MWWDNRLKFIWFWVDWLLALSINRRQPHVRNLHFFRHSVLSTRYNHKLPKNVPYIQLCLALRAETWSGIVGIFQDYLMAILEKAVNLAILRIIWWQSFEWSKSPQRVLFGEIICWTTTKCQYIKCLSVRNISKGKYTHCCKCSFFFVCQHTCHSWKFLWSICVLLLKRGIVEDKGSVQCNIILRIIYRQGQIRPQKACK